MLMFKYIDPIYMIWACRENASDAILCNAPGQNAVRTIVLRLFGAVFSIHAY